MAFQPTLYKPNSPRVKNFPDQLRDILLAKMQEVDPPGLEQACLKKDGNYLTGLCSQAYTALKVREKTNNNDGLMVEMTQKVGGGRKGWAWCMYEMQACVGMAEILTGTVSKFPYSGSCASVRAGAKKIPGMVVEFAHAIYGSIFIKVYKNGTGHTGCFKKWIVRLKTMILNEGNTTAGKIGDKVVREGGGSYQTERSLNDGWVMCCIPFALVDNAPIGQDLPASDENHIPAFNERSDRVLSMQNALNKIPGFSIGVDGWFYNETRTALSRFQKLHGLRGTGIPGPETMKLLGLMN